MVGAVSRDSAENDRIVAAAKAFVEKGAFSDALMLVDEALAFDSSNGDLLFVRAATLFGWGRHAEARALLIRLAQASPPNAELCVKLGWSCFWLARVEEAAEWMRKAVSLQPDDWSTQFGWGTVLRAQKRTAASKAAFERALALKPDDPHCISNLVACEVALDHLDSAERYARGALERDPQSSSAQIDLGIVLCTQARYAEAVAAFERADELEFSSIDARDESVNYAICLLRAGRTQQAMRMMEGKLRLYPSGALHYHYGLALLAAGRMREGWDHYEFRWLQEPLLSWRPEFVKPVWSGENLRGKTILLRSEQGYGDFIQFVRYAPRIKVLGATVMLRVRKELAGLAEEVTGIDRVVVEGSACPPFDCYINLLSIPRVLGTDLESIPADVPYLRVPPNHVTPWETTIVRDGKLNVGIVWAGSPTHLGDRFRSLTLRALAPLRAVAGVRFFSLQKGPAAAELVTDHGYDPLVDLGPNLVTFADTAAAIERLDLVIGVDTAVVHLAGALAKPVWTLVAIPGDWRWLEQRDDSPWYPTMRLFRQRTAGDWDEVVGRLRTALEGEVGQHGRELAEDSVPAVSVALTHAAGLSQNHATRPTARALGLTRNASGALCRIAETRAGIMMYCSGDRMTTDSIELYGECMQLQLEMFARFLVAGMTVMEVGAGIGAHAVPIASLLGPDGHLFLYENDPFIKQVLHENLKANRVSNTTLMRRSLSCALDGLGDGASAPPISNGSGSDGCNRSKYETIDELRLERLDWLKATARVDADVVIRGAETTIWRLRPRLFIAVEDDDKLGEVAVRARDLGYTCWRAEAPLFNRMNFNQRGDDVFEGRTSVALVAVPEEESEFGALLEGCSRLA